MLDDVRFWAVPTCYSVVDKPENVNRHPHYAEIIAWANGAVIQYKSRSSGKWEDTNNNKPIWGSEYEYRVKPFFEKEKDRIEELQILIKKSEEEIDSLLEKIK